MTDHHFIMNKHGRSGTITYHEGARRIDIYWEISGTPRYDIVFVPIELREWDDPKGAKINKEDQLKILRNLRQWLKGQNTRSTIDLPLGMTTTDQRCAWASCDERKIKGSAYCPRHYDLNLLRD